MVFLSLLRPELVSLINYAALGISGSLIVNIVTLLFVVYFGYFILVDAKYFLDLASTRFEHKERGKLQNITYDIAGLISLVLISALLTPILSSIKDAGGTASKVTDIVLLAIGFLIIYHLANEIYTVVKQRFERLISNNRQIRRDKNRSNVEMNQAD